MPAGAHAVASKNATDIYFGLRVGVGIGLAGFNVQA